MPRPLVSVLNPSVDYPEIQGGVDAVSNVAAFGRQHRIALDWNHDHRLWEYGTAIQILLNKYTDRGIHNLEVLEVGAGWGRLGPALVLSYNAKVTECEPNGDCKQARAPLNAEFARMNFNQIELITTGIEDLPNRLFDAVFCISVIEHVKDEKQGWLELATRVKPGGVLFITTDIVPERNRTYVYDHLRTHNYTIDELKDRVEMIVKLGFDTIGTPDYTYYGNHVHDYSFFRAGFIKHAVLTPVKPPMRPYKAKHGE